MDGAVFLVACSSRAAARFDGGGGRRLGGGSATAPGMDFSARKSRGGRDARFTMACGRLVFRGVDIGRFQPVCREPAPGGELKWTQADFSKWGVTSWRS